jgi:hypothetical protein
MLTYLPIGSIEKSLWFTLHLCKLQTGGVDSRKIDWLISNKYTFGYIALIYEDFKQKRITLLSGTPQRTVSPPTKPVLQAKYVGVMFNNALDYDEIILGTPDCRKITGLNKAFVPKSFDSGLMAGRSVP